MPDVALANVRFQLYLASDLMRGVEQTVVLMNPIVSGYSRLPRNLNYIFYEDAIDHLALTLLNDFICTAQAHHKISVDQLSQ